MTKLYDFDGETYDKNKDQVRLSRQIDKVQHFLEGNDYVTLDEISAATGIKNMSSISARIGDLRKDRHGNRVVDRKYVSDGLYSYKLMPKER
jgi:hypothetical protein